MAAPLAASKASLLTVRYIHYLYPTALFVWFVASQAASICTLSNLGTPKKAYQKWLFILLQIVIIASYVAEAVLMCVHSLAEQGWWSSSDNVIYILTSILVWGVVEVAIIDTEKPVWYPYYGTWLLSLVSEGILLSLSVSTLDPNKFEVTRLLIEGSRILIFFAMPLGVWAVRERDLENAYEESTRLLGPESVQPSTYGSVFDQDNDVEDLRGAKTRMLKKIEESGNWWTYAKSFALFWPYIWPKNERWLQFSMVLVGGCLVAERGLNVMVPHQLGVVTNSLMEGSGNIPWLQLLLYVLYRWLDSGSGVSALQGYLWMPLDQYSHRTLTTAAYNHVMSLSYDFHSNKKTGEIWSSITQGRAVNGFIETILFQVIPMLVDLCVAFAYFFILFDAYMALIVAVVSVVYLWVTAKLSAMRNDIRRDLNLNARNEISILIETISSWTTVSYFNRIPYEQSRYLGALRLFQKAERRWLIGISVLGVAQSLIFTIGLLAASFLAVYEVTRGVQPVGSFITLLSYWAQLSGPLSFFATFYRKVQTQMLDAERLLELFETKPSITDQPAAIELEKVTGTVDFENVCFSYDSRKPAITDVNFHVPSGTTVAFVGETGGGKTTCLKLLFRFFDVQSGSIKIDGHDIRDIKLASLRDHMGVVPQDPELFNDTIMSNIKYANFGAEDNDVYEACRAASIHEKILSFPDGYLSKVGERGIRLSGGELQRVSIARAILKNPKIILLDEATSMIDMETERQIQDAFNKLAKDRTMFIVAHRLSTIMNADQIIVIKKGRVVEKGSHDQLLDAKGMYFQLWSKQSKPDDPPLNPVSKTPLLIEDLFDASTRDETGCHDSSRDVATSSQNLEQILIPEAAKGSIRTTSTPTVAFSLPERTVWGPEPRSQPSINPRMAAPNHGILKNPTRLQGLGSNNKGLNIPSKPASLLKPDAKEFVPRGYSVVARDSTTDTFSGGVIPAETTPKEMSLEGILANQIEVESLKVKELVEETLFDGPNPGKTAPTQEGGQTLTVTCLNNTNIEAAESTGEDVGNTEPEIDNTQEARKRRRRVRRRSNKLRSGESEENTDAKQNSSEGTETEAVADIADSPAAIEGEGPQAIGGNVGSSNGSVVKPKRRFRNGNKLKNNGSEFDTEAPLSAPLSALPDTGNGTAMFKVRPRTGYSNRSGTKLPYKEGQSPENGQQSDCLTSSSKRENMQRRNSGGDKCQEQRNGTWHKGLKKSKSSESGNSASES